MTGEEEDSGGKASEMERLLQQVWPFCFKNLKSMEIKGSSSLEKMVKIRVTGGGCKEASKGNWMWRGDWENEAFNNSG